MVKVNFKGKGSRLKKYEFSHCHYYPLYTVCLNILYYNIYNIKNTRVLYAYIIRIVFLGQGHNGQGDDIQGQGQSSKVIGSRSKLIGCVSNLYWWFLYQKSSTELNTIELDGIQLLGKKIPKNCQYFCECFSHGIEYCRNFFSELSK